MGILILYTILAITGTGVTGTHNHQILEPMALKHPMPKERTRKSSGDTGYTQTIYVAYQGNSEVDLCTDNLDNFATDFYEVLRDGKRIAFFPTTGVLIWRDSTVTSGNTYNYQINTYQGDSLWCHSTMVTAHPGQVGGLILNNTVWKKKDSPFIVSGHVDLEDYWGYTKEGILITSWIPPYTDSCPTLTIEPGVEVEFDDDYGLHTYDGKFNIKALGTKKDIIKMVPLNPSPHRGIWTGIDLIYGGKASFSWVEIAYAARGLDCSNNSGKNAIKVDSCWFLKDSVGIYSGDEPDLHISGSFFGDCDKGMWCTSTSSPAIISSEFAYNKDGIWAVDGAVPCISKSNFCGNKEKAIRNTTQGKIQANNCWWGYPTGPKDISDPKCKGEGDEIYGYVSGGVIYSGFMPSPYNLTSLPLPDFRVDSIKVVQTIDNVELVASRPLVIRAFISPGRSKSAELPTVEAYFGGKSCLSPEPVPDSVKYNGCWRKDKEVSKGLNSVNWFMLDTSKIPSSSCSLNVQVSISPLADEERDCADDNNEDTVKVGFKALWPIWKTSYMGLYVGDWIKTSSRPSVSDLKQFALNNHSFLESVFPARMAFNFKGYYNSTAWTRTGALVDLKVLVAIGETDYALGFVPAEWLGKDRGLTTTNFIYRYTSLIGYRLDYPPNDYWVSTHEISHTFGRDDEYIERDDDGNFIAGNPKWDDTHMPWGYMASNGWAVNRKAAGCIYNMKPADSTSALNFYGYMGNSMALKHWMPRVDYDAIYKNIFSAKKYKTANNRLLANIVIYQNDSTNALPFYKLGTGIVDTGTQGDYSLECLDTVNAILSSVKFFADPWEFDSTSGLNTFYACIAIDYPANTKKVVLTHNSKTIFQRQVSQHSPTVHIIYPNGDSIQDSIKVIWSAADPDGDKLSYAFLYSDIATSGWTLLAINLTDTTYTVHSDFISSNVKFKIIATDGVNSTADSSNASSGVRNKPPVVFIITPRDSSSFAYNQNITLSGDATDVEDGTLPDSSLVWISGTKDTIGFGYSINKTMSQGTYNITLCGKDSKGAVGNNTITLIVVTDTLPDLYVTKNNITTNRTPVINDTCWIIATVNNTIRDANCVASIYLNGLNPSCLLASDSMWVEANKFQAVNAMWLPTKIGQDTIWVKISGASPGEGDTTNNIASKVFTVIATEEKQNDIPKVLFLNQNYPNPLSRSTSIKFGLPKKGNVSIKVYDIAGKLVKTLANSEYQPGCYTIVWNGCNEHNRKVTNGIYFLRLQQGKENRTCKALLMMCK